MKTLQISIPEGCEIDIENSDLSKGTIAYKKAENKYPTEIGEIKRRIWFIDNLGNISYDKTFPKTINNMSSERRAKAILALIQLLEFMDAWNKVDEFVPDWTNYKQTKYGILFSENECLIISCYTSSRPLVFNSKKTAEKFLNQFKPLIEEARELL